MSFSTLPQCIHVSLCISLYSKCFIWGLPQLGHTYDSDFIRFHMTKQFKGRKKVEEPKTEVKPDELTIDLDED